MKCDRRSVKSNLMSLKELGYDINLKRGIFIRRDFEESELRMLIDGVLFSKNISRNQAKRLIEKLKNLGSNQFSAKVTHIANLPELQHSDNTRVMFNLDVINDAISKNKKISFIYNSYDENLKLKPRRNEIYIVSPYQMAAANGFYYLICNTDGHENIVHYRIDKMTEVKMLKIPAKNKNQIAEFIGGTFNLPKHLKNKKLALENFDKFVELSGEKNFYDLLGEIYFALGDYEKAVENFSKHLEIESYAVETYYLRGRSYFEQKNFAKALADFEKYVSTMYELMSDGCYFSDSETNYAEAKNFCDLCKKNLEVI